MEEILYEEPLYMLPSPVSSSWVLRQVNEIRKRMGISFEGMEEKTEELFLGIECWREATAMKGRGLTRRMLRNGCHEIKNLVLDINYEGFGRKRGEGDRLGRKSGRRDRKNDVVCYDEHTIVEREGSW